LSDDDDSDEALVARAGRGDRSAASLLIARHSARVMSVCVRVLGDKAAAEDAAQETFLKLWENAARWRPAGARFEAWLCRIATNACLDRLRRRKHEAGETEASELADGAPSALDRLSADDRRKIVEKALSRLPDRQRIAVTLCHMQDLSNAEAAAAMNISVDAVESLLRRGRIGLKDALLSMRADLLEGAP
jgi:RNA polymerase sigma-70 factor (ECF subfamily)